MIKKLDNEMNNRVEVLVVMVEEVRWKQIKILNECITQNGYNATKLHQGLSNKYYKQGTKIKSNWHLSLDIKHPMGICFCYISLHLPEIAQNLISAGHWDQYITLH